MILLKERKYIITVLVATTYFSYAIFMGREEHSGISIDFMVGYISYWYDDGSGIKTNTTGPIPKWQDYVQCIAEGGIR